MDERLSKQTLHHFIENILTCYPSNPALAMVGKAPETYSDMLKRVRDLRDELRLKGVEKGQKIALLGDNSPNWCVAYLAITCMGAVVVPILSEFPESDINHIITHCDASGIFIDQKFYESMDLNAVGRLEFVFSLDTLQQISGKARARSRPGQSVKKPVVIEENDLAEILYTSGTTGHSKGVMLTHRNIVTNALAGPKAFGGLDPSWIILNLLPLAHAYGSTTSFLGGLSQGSSIYFLDRKPSPKILMDSLQLLRPHLVTGVPLIFEKIYHKKVLPEITRRKMLHLISRFDLGRKFLYRKIGKKVLASFGGRLQSFIIGGASLNREVELFLREGNIPFAIGYGLSECAPLVAGDFYKRLKFGSVGRAVENIQIRIDQPDPASGVGEIWVKGPNVMLGYFKNPPETEQVFSDNNWLKTGDLGYLDDDGYLYIKGRIKNVYVGPSGENIYPEIIEDKLRESMMVEEALVYIEDGKLLGRIYPDYDYIQTALQADKHVIQPADIEKILETVRRETNTKLPVFSQINKILEQPEPFIKTPTNKIKRMLYVPNYSGRVQKI